LTCQKGETRVDWEGLTFFANVLWVAIFGWWMSLLLFTLSGLMAITIVGVPYANLSFILGKYFLWPYGKYIIERVTQPGFFSLQQREPPHKKLTLLLARRMVRTCYFASGISD
jgi:uncharacterized membrane protein YccF (DUF307 family)